MNIPAWMKRDSKAYELVMAYGQILLGCLIGGAAYPLFLTPNSIAPGGLTGVATITNVLLGWPVGIVSLALNIPLFLIGYRSMGRIFAFRSLIAMVIFSLAIDLEQFEPMTNDPLLGTLFGGVVLGIGLGLILRGGATTGGTDMIAQIVHSRLSFISTGTFLFGVDFLVVIAAGIFMGMSEALYALICIWVSAKVIDMVVMGFSGNKACYIISGETERISHHIMHDMERGATLLSAKGAWTKEDRPVLLCVLNQREVPRLKGIVREADPTAFMFVTDTYEALGEGFGKLDKGNGN